MLYRHPILKALRLFLTEVNLLKIAFFVLTVYLLDEEFNNFSKFIPVNLLNLSSKPFRNGC